MKALVRKYVPRKVWGQLVMGKAIVLDAVDTALGRRDELIPPRRLIFIGNGDFRKTGNEFLSYFKELGGLQPHHRVLDLGCGIGRMAVPLVEYLGATGSYEGLDIVPHGIQWCTDHITSKHPNFRFQVADVLNKEYNPDGRFLASNYRFPYADESFDFVFLTSVFTHMLPDEVENYLREIHRVLKAGGRAFNTWFLLNSESQRLIDQGLSSFDFRHAVGECLTTNPSTPEEAICYREDRVLRVYERLRFRVESPIRYGSWCGRKNYLSFQDVCIAHKVQG